VIGGQPDGGHFPGPLAAFALTIGGVVAATFATVFVMGLFGSEPSVASMGIGEALGLGAVASYAAQRVAAPQRERLGLKTFDLSFLPILAMLVPLVVVMSELDNILRAFVPPPEIPPELADMQEQISSASFLTTLETFLVAVGIAPVVEEWLFRGVIQQGLIAHLSRVRGVMLTAALFAIVHLGPSPSGPSALSPFISSFALGLVLGAVRLATGSLLACILVSAGVSAAGLAAISLADTIPIPGFNAPGAHTSIEILAPALFAVAWSLSLVLRGARDAPAEIPLPQANPSRELYPRDEDEDRDKD
jgi:membrane protease YdiL (CAAX protease family)